MKMNIDERVERELVQVVESLREIIPSLQEVRVYGSYQDGNWNLKKSDIDIFVVVNNSAETLGDKETFKKKLREGYYSRFHFCIMFNGDYQNLLRGGSSIVEVMSKGRLLYSTHTGHQNIIMGSN